MPLLDSICHAACLPLPQGKELIEDLTVLRFANLVFEPLWSRQYIRNVQARAVEGGRDRRGLRLEREAQ